MVATRMLRARAVGFITSGATPTSAIAARYPDAPACPTDEYSTAATKISPINSPCSPMARDHTRSGRPPARPATAAGLPDGWAQCAVAFFPFLVSAKYV